MNSYTLTSKIIKKNILISFILVIIAFIGIDIFLYLYSNLKTTKSTFIEEKSSKIKHFNLNNKLDRDYIFIGSSRTIFHVSTDVFKKNGLDIYNFGVSGNFLVDYPTYIYEAINQKPKNIVISMPINILYSEIKEAKRPFLDDVILFNSLNNKELYYDSVFHWFKNIHLFLAYSEAIVVKSKLLYDKFEPVKLAKKKRKERTKSINNFEDMIDCTVFSIQKINENKIIKKCSNGDGILFGSSIKNKGILNREKEFKKINPNTINLISKYIQIIKNNNINPIIVFEPVLDNHYIYSLKEIEQILNYIDLTNFKVEKINWADSGHLNVNGRKIYSEYLSKYLKDNKK